MGLPLAPVSEAATPSYVQPRRCGLADTPAFSTCQLQVQATLYMCQTT